MKSQKKNLKWKQRGLQQMYNDKPVNDYCYPNTGVLINYYNERDQKKLDVIEANHTLHRLIELYNAPILGAFGLKHLQKIHKYIFQDVYPFAGELRTVNIYKNGQGFAPCLYLTTYANEIFKQLKAEKHLKGLNKQQFCKRLSYCFTEVNMIHPFREGNGRTQREFFRTLAAKNGYILDWSKISREEMMDASIKGRLDEKSFVHLFEKSIINNEPDLDLMKKIRDRQRSNELEL